MNVSPLPTAPTALLSLPAHAMTLLAFGCHLVRTGTRKHIGGVDYGYSGYNLEGKAGRAYLAHGIR
jgi:hypothetical protein